MLSQRGHAYAQAGLMTGYLREKGELYNKQTNQQGEVSFANAENFAMHDEVLNYINAHYEFDATHCTYNQGPIGTKRLREAMASHLNDYFDPFVPVTLEQVFTLLTDNTRIPANDKRCQLVYTSFGDINQFGVDAVSKYEEAILKAAEDGVKIRAMLICNPHNPVGKCYTIDALKALFALCHKYNIHLISDEIYGLSVFDVGGSKRTPFTSVLSIDPTGLLRTDQIHVLYGMSKDFGAAGLRLGCLVSQNKEMTKATRAIGRFHWPSEMSCAIATTILEDKAFVAKYTEKSREVLSEHYSIATRIFEDAGIDYVRNGNAGFFLWIDLSPYLTTKTADSEGWQAETTLKKAILNAGVEMASGAKYREETPGWFRVLFTVEKDALEEALDRIIATAKSQKSSPQ